MNDIPPIKATAMQVGTQPPPSNRGTGQAGPTSVEHSVPEDRVDISEVGQALSSMEAGDEARAGKILEIRQAIADGTYMTEAKIHFTIGRLMEEL